MLIDLPYKVAFFLIYLFRIQIYSFVSFVSKN